MLVSRQVILFSVLLGDAMSMRGTVVQFCLSPMMIEM